MLTMPCNVHLTFKVYPKFLMFDWWNSHINPLISNITKVEPKHTEIEQSSRNRISKKAPLLTFVLLHIHINILKRMLTYFSFAWASEGTVDPFPLAYMLAAECHAPVKLSRTTLVSSLWKQHRFARTHTLIGQYQWYTVERLETN